MSQPKVIYIGQKISQGKRELMHDRTAVIRKTAEPQTVKELRAFLGVCNYNRNWVEYYTEIAQPLNDLLKGQPDFKAKIKMEDEPQKTFEELKQHLCEAPVLGLPNVHRPFTLFVKQELQVYDFSAGAGTRRTMESGGPLSFQIGHNSFGLRSMFESGPSSLPRHPASEQSCTRSTTLHPLPTLCHRPAS